MGRKGGGRRKEGRKEGRKEEGRKEGSRRGQAMAKRFSIHMTTAKPY